MATLSVQAKPVLPALRARRGYLEPYDLPLLVIFATSAVIGVVTGQPALQFQRWVLPNVLIGIGVILAMLVLVGLLRLAYVMYHHRRISRHALRVALARHLGGRSVLLAARYVVAFELVRMLSTTLVQLTPRIRTLPNMPRLPRVFDSIVMDLESTLHLGALPGLALAKMEAPAGWFAALDALQAYWPVWIGLLIAMAVTGRDRMRSDRFLSSLLVVWFVCAVVGLLLPCTGPFLMQQDVFPPQAMPMTAEAQALRFHHWTLDLFVGRTGVMLDGGGLLGFPSLPVAAAALAAVYLWRCVWPLRLAGVVVLAMVFLAMLTAGWHSAVSGYAAMLLALGAWFAVGLMIRWMMRRRHAPPRGDIDEQTRPLNR